MENLIQFMVIVGVLSVVFYLVEVIMGWIISKVCQWIVDTDKKDDAQPSEALPQYSPKDIQTANFLQRKHQINQAFLRTQRALLDELNHSRKR